MSFPKADENQYPPTRLIEAIHPTLVDLCFSFGGLEMSRIAVSRQRLIARLPADRHHRVVVDPSHDFSRSDGRDRDGDGIPAIVMRPSEITGKMIRVDEVYNRHQAEDRLRDSRCHIVCMVEDGLMLGFDAEMDSIEMEDA